MSSADKSIAVFDNGTLVASGTVEITDPKKPLGERVFTFTGAAIVSDVLRWEATGLGKGPAAEDNSTALRRSRPIRPCGRRSASASSSG